MVSTVLILSSLFPQSNENSTEDIGSQIYFLEISEDIMPAALRKLENATKDPNFEGIDAFILKLNTYGGQVDVADKMRNVLLDIDATTIAFIDNQAISAGALLAIACDSIYMSDAAAFGSATVVDQAGEVLPDKYQSFMRAMFRSTAETKGRNPDIAEAMVDPEIEVPGVSEKGQVLNFTPSEAMKNGYCEAQLNDMDEVLNRAGFKGAEQTSYEETWIEGVISFLLNPVVSSLLMMMMIGGIWFELQTPGLGFPIVAALIGAILYFAPLYLNGLAEHWEIALFVIGVFLILAEIFVIPGFGIAGIAGIACMLAGLTLSLVGNVQFDFEWVPLSSFGFALSRTLLAITLGAVLAIALGGGFTKSKLFKRVSIEEIQDSSQGYSTEIVEHRELVGKTGVAATPLRPSGKVEISDVRYDATTDGEFIEKGSTVKVIASKANYLIVQEIENFTT